MVLAATLLLLGASALLMSGILFTHQRISTYLATAAVLGQGMWLLLALIDRAIPQTETTFIFLSGSAIFFVVAALVGYRRYTSPLRSPYYWMCELPVLGIIALVLTSALTIACANGFMDDGTWVTHGFYNGDTTTFISLVQRSFLTDGLVTTNPFAAGGALEYPTLLHGGIATFFAWLGLQVDWLSHLTLITQVQALIIGGVVFLLFDVVLPIPPRGQRWLGVQSQWFIHGIQFVVVGVILTAAWDNYIFPQSHFFLTGLYIVLAAVLYQRPSLSGSVIGFLLTIILLLTNAVTGTVAVALWIAYCLVHGSKSQNIKTCLPYIASALFIVALFVLVPPGDGSLGWPHFSYSAAETLLRLSPLIVLLLVGVALQYRQESVPTLAVAALLLLGILTFLFSNRPLVVANASRFWYHALVLGMPLLVRPMVRLVSWYKTCVWHSSHTWLQAGTISSVLVAGILLACVPSLSSSAAAFDHLLFKDRQTVSLARQELLQWIATSTSNDAVVITSPYAPWDVPIFTGRSLLRASHEASVFWLSPDDALLAQHRLAFLGDAIAQQELLAQADYLILRPEDFQTWPAIPAPLVFENHDGRVYRLR